MASRLFPHIATLLKEQVKKDPLRFTAPWHWLRRGVSFIRRHRLVFIRLLVIATVTYIILSQCQGNIKCCTYIILGMLLSCELLVFITRPIRQSSPVLSMTDLNINDCLEAALNAVGAYFVPDVTIQKMYGEPPSIKVDDPDRLIMMFCTILGNALQAIRHSGKMSIHTTHAVDNIVVRIGTATINNALRVSSPKTDVINCARSVLHDYGGTIERHRHSDGNTDYTITLPILWN